MADEPQFISDCDDPECVAGCSMTEFPVWMRPYRCRHVTDDERATREAVFNAPPRPSLDDLLGKGWDGN